MEFKKTEKNIGHVMMGSIPGVALAREPKNTPENMWRLSIKEYPQKGAILKAYAKVKLKT